MVQSINEIEDGSFTPTEQDESKASPAPKIFTEDCKIDFHQPAQKVHNRIRGLSPFPAAWAELDDLKFNMYRSEVAEDESLDPGQIAHKNGDMLVGCETKSIILDEVKIEGKKKMSGNDFMNGYHGTGVLH